LILKAVMENLMTETTCLPFDPEVAPPRQRLPQGSCDCHFHVFEDVTRYPLVEGRSYSPAPAPMADYQRMMTVTGIERAVLVQPSVYGSDHTLFVDMLQAHGTWLRGVAVVRADTPEKDIETWHRLGSRGARVNALYAAGAPIAEIEAIVARIRPHGWHLQVCIDVDAQPQLLERIVDMGVPVVVDHMGHLPAERAAGSRGVANLVALLREERVWTKLSGPYRLTAQRTGFSDVRPLVDRLVDANARRLVWGSDWPHPSIAAPMVNDTDLVNLLGEWLGDASLRQRVLVENPTTLYWGT
jgi:predicted TIM-barrel fold metal-dependent hydrolase